MSDLKACAIAELPAEMEPYLFFFSDQLIALAYFDSGDVHTGEALSELRSFMLRCSNITYRFQHTANETLSVGISYIHHSLATARKAYEEAMLSLEYRFFNGRGSVIYRGDLPDCPELPAPPVSPDKKMIVFAASGNMQELSRQLERFRSSFHELKISNIKIIKTLMLGILLQTLNQLQEHGFDDIVENASLALEGNTSLHLLQCETFESAFELFKDSLMHMCKSVMESGPARFDNTIHQAVGYIQTNYDKNLTVKQVADYVGLNTSYFSHRFKKVMGVSFTSFLTKTRMDKAKSLLENRNLKTSHIAELVGIQDPRYFSKLFKSYIGSTPSEFKGNVSRRLP